MMNKNISLENYLKYFYEHIKINTPKNEIETLSTPIFYKVCKSKDLLTISFTFMGFFINVNVPLTMLREKYAKVFEVTFEDSVIPDFMMWIDSKYMDNRGIEEI